MSALVRLPPQIARLIPRLASDHDGEIVATAKAIGRCLAAQGLDFHSLVAAIGPVQAAPRRAETTGEEEWRDLAEWCAKHSSLLRTKEAEFVQEMLDWDEPSEKQLSWLNRIAARLRREGL